MKHFKKHYIKGKHQTKIKGHRYLKSLDQRIKAKPTGKRTSKNKKVYYEYRQNRTDLNPKTKL